MHMKMNCKSIPFLLLIPKFQRQTAGALQGAPRGTAKEYHPLVCTYVSCPLVCTLGREVVPYCILKSFWQLCVAPEVSYGALLESPPAVDDDWLYVIVGAS